MSKKSKKDYAKRTGVVRNCYLGAKFTETERKLVFERLGIKDGGNASRMIRLLLLNGEIK